ncbi:electron transporter [Acaryochloris sp. IP29b_bin.137]|uniref:cyclic electron transport protein PGR5 n=1 Tax=Acaryochloris sp. IP29b_bin.137 TaxID=2969217 RepID=UPI00260FA623|nr:electron transporter [Acaryochloris sp. IP29b_bin.137]
MFAPFVIQIDHILGHQRFIRLRGKAIAIHIQVINQFCDRMGVDRSCRQHLIKTAHHNGQKMGLMI